MSDTAHTNDKPVEIFCPICGYTTLVKEADHGLEGLSREEKIKAIQKLQESDHPIVICKGCDDPGQTAKIMEVR
jgi:hypothetical protein